MSPTRRTFVRQASALGLLYGAHRALPQAAGQMPGMKMPGSPQKDPSGTLTPNPPRVGPKTLNAFALPPFVDPLPLPEALRPTMRDGKRSVTVTMREIHAKLHRDVPASRLWSYGDGAMAPLIEARRGEPLHITWVNNLPEKHFLPIDHSLHGAGKDVPEVRTVAHLHGAKVETKDDGYPSDWFVPGKSRTCIYPFDQEAATLWYHDHAMGINRLNTYAGLFGMLLLRDKTEDALNLPSGKYEVPLILYDRNLSTEGQVFYDVSGDPETPWIPEFSADAIIVNGKIRPYFEVEPRLYRFRLLNTANSRFFILSLSDDHAITQIGSDQGLLAAPVEMPRIVLAPAERADVLIDFSKFAGQNVHLVNGALPIIQFRVAKQPPVSASIPKTLRHLERIPESAATNTRKITLHEYQDNLQRPMIMLINRKHWHEPCTEFVKLNTTEIWEFINLTEDTHPMHIHLVRFQILDRRSFDITEFLRNKRLVYTSELMASGKNELGWKDTVQCPPNSVTRVIVPFEGYTGKYLYHCHILEHEANDMMRPFEVVA